MSALITQETASVLGALCKELGAETRMYFLLSHTYQASNIWREFNPRKAMAKSKWKVWKESTIFRGKKRWGREKAIYWSRKITGFCQLTLVKQFLLNSEFPEPRISRHLSKSHYPLSSGRKLSIHLS